MQKTKTQALADMNKSTIYQTQANIWTLDQLDTAKDISIRKQELLSLKKRRPKITIQALAPIDLHLISDSMTEMFTIPPCWRPYLQVREKVRGD